MMVLVVSLYIYEEQFEKRAEHGKKILDDYSNLRHENGTQNSIAWWLCNEDGIGSQPKAKSS